MVNWTKEQQQAIQHRGSNLLVAAGAGSGKTAVLIQRILGKVLAEENPVDVDQILVVTYTNAAAAEMRQRLARAFYGALKAEPNNRHIQRQMVLLQRAQITTLHAFCLDTIKKYFYLLDLDPKSRIGNSGELLLLRDRVLDTVFDRFYGREDSPLELLLSYYSRGIEDQEIKSLILQIAEFSNSMAEPMQWLDSLVLPYTQGKVDRWLSYIKTYLQQQLGGFAKGMLELVALAQNPANGLEAYLKNLVSEAEAIQLALTGFGVAFSQGADMSQREASNWNLLLASLGQITFGRMPVISKKNQYNPEAKAFISAYRTQVKTEVRKLQEIYGDKSYEQIVAEITGLAPVAQGLIQLTKAFQKEWQQKKKAKKLLEFGDLEHYCLALLNQEGLGVSQGLQKEFAEVFVDEYQDINQVQEAILAKVSRADNRFMVGDMKQSIYRFRLAEPSLFGGKFTNYGQNTGGKRIDLQQNFRSQGLVIAGVNLIFSQLLSGGDTEIVYDQGAKLVAGNTTYPLIPPKLLLIDEAKPVSYSAESFAENKEGEGLQEEQEDSFEAGLKVAEVEAQVIADQIKKLVGGGRAYQDIVILLRSPKNWAGLMQDVLKANGIPCQTDTAAAFAESAEIEMLYSLLKVIDNPRQDIELATVLHSPLVGLTLAELADLRLLAPQKNLYEGLMLASEPRLVGFYQKLSLWRQQSKLGAMGDFIKKIYRQTGLVYAVKVLPQGQKRQQNLETLLNMAKEYDGNSFRGLYGFLSFLEKNFQQGARGEQVEKAQNAVSIMSIHRSKGLEFPVVFVAGLGKKFNQEDVRKDILLHRHLGLGLRLVDLEKRIKYPTLAYSVLAKKVSWETKAEELRVLYVAMTRAQEDLFLVGTTKSASRLIAKAALVLNQPQWQIPQGLLEGENTYLYWLVLALLRHPVGAKLLQLAGVEPAAQEDVPLALQAELAFYSHSSNWELGWLNKEDGKQHAKPQIQILGSQAESAQLEQPWLTALRQDQPLQGAVSAQIQERLQYRYAWEPLTKIPIKWSATGFNRFNPVVLKPSEAADNQQGKDFAALGTGIHLLLEKADLAAIGAGKEPEALLGALLKELVAAKKIPQQLAGEIDTVGLAQFFKGTLGKNLLKAAQGGGRILRESNFTLVLSLAELAELHPDFRLSLDLKPEQWAAFKSQQVFFQGTIDLAFLVKDGWVLVDYKTGKNQGSTDAELSLKYGSQLRIYEKALAKSTSISVAQSFIYFTANNRLVQVLGEGCEK